MKVFEDNPKNIYAIKHRLGELKKHKSDSCFHYYVGGFIVKIFTHKIQEAGTIDIMSNWIINPDGTHSVDKSLDDCITKHKDVDVQLYENKKGPGHTVYEAFINMDFDSRFCNYEPIKHGDKWGSRTGDSMPIINLCELIKYLHRLSNLAVFF
jgi:hypothetical protein